MSRARSAGTTIPKGHASQSQKGVPHSGEVFTPTPVTPIGFSDLIQWHRADSDLLVPVTQVHLGPPPTTEDNKVSPWPGESTNQYQATQTDLDLAPTFVENVLNGYPGILFEAASLENMGISFAPDTFAQPTTIIVVSQAVSFAAATEHVMVDGIAGGSSQAIQSNAGTPAKWAINSGTEQATAGDSDTDPHIFVAQFDATDLLYIDGSTPVISADAGAQSLTGMTFGASINEDLFWDGYLFEIASYSRAITKGEINALCGGYLAPKYGLTWTTIP